MRELVLAVVAVAVEAAFIVGLLVRARRHRRRTPDAFRCRLRTLTPRLPERRYHRWRARSCWAAWAHDVLLVQAAPFAVPRVLKVRFPEGPVTPANDLDDIEGLGAGCVVLRLRLDDGGVVDITAPASARELVAGPFLAACITQDH